MIKSAASAASRETKSRGRPAGAQTGVPELLRDEARARSPSSRTLASPHRSTVRREKRRDNAAAAAMQDSARTRAAHQHSGQAAAAPTTGQFLEQRLLMDA